MKIPQNEPLYGKEEIKAITDYLNQEPHPWLMEHKKTRELEAMISDFVGSPYCSVVSHGTDALLASLMALGIKPNDEVVIPSFSHLVDAMVVSVLGAKPVLVDIEPDSLGMSEACLKQAITDKTKAVILVSINGRFPKDWLEILAICEKRSIPVVEDGAQALGSYFNIQELKSHIGTLGLIGCYSLSMPKIITGGAGGFLVTHDKKLYEKIKMIKDFGRPYGGIDFAGTIGLNFKFTDLQAVFLIEQFKRLLGRIKRKKEMFNLYRDLLRGCDKVRFLDTNNRYTTVWMPDILLENKEERDNLLVNLNKSGIETRNFYSSLHMQKPYRHVKGDFPYSTQASDCGLWLPSSLKLTDEDIKYVCDNILGVLC